MPPARVKSRGIPPERRSSTRFLARVVEGACAADMPGFIRPAEAVAAATPPKGSGHVHEIRFAGMRIAAHLEGKRPKLFAADGEQRTGAFARIATALGRLPVNQIVLDGVVIVQDSAGRSDPAALEADIAAGRQDRFVYYAFDLLHLDGFDMTAATLTERKRILATLLKEAGEGPIAYSEDLDIPGTEMLARAKALGLAGIVSKRAIAPYRSGRTKDWVSVNARPAAKRKPPARAPAAPKSKAAVSAARPLLVIDGDSFAHRAYHALPKSIRRTGNKGGNAIVGFANYLLRFYASEKPRAVLACWDTLAEPNWRQKIFAPYQGGREFEDSIVDQLDVLPEFVAACGFANAKGAGYEADDFLAAAVAKEEKKDGTVIVASGDRDAFQLASDSTTILHPVKAGEMARIGPAEVRERYGVEPAQVPDFIALRGDPSDRIPGLRGVGPAGAATLLRRYGSLENAFAAGKFVAEAEDLRLYRKIATMDRTAPLPRLADQTPRWDKGAALAKAWGLIALAERLTGLARDDA